MNKPTTIETAALAAVTGGMVPPRPDEDPEVLAQLHESIRSRVRNGLPLYPAAPPGRP